MEDFTFFDFKPNAKGRGTLYHNEARLTNGMQNKTLYFNARIRGLVFSMGLTKLRIRKDNLTGDVHFVFNKDTGLPCGGVTKKNLYFANKEMICALYDILGLDKNNKIYTLTLSDNMAKGGEFLTYKIIGKTPVE